MNYKKYKPRLVDKKVCEYLASFGAVCIEGAKWCGKTWTSSHHCNSEIFIGDPAGNFQNRKLAELNPELILSGENPRMIDEWQEVPGLWDAVRYKVDEEGKKGQFILTGSATPNHKGIMHSGAGRISRIRMRPMSLYEAGFSTGKVSLKELCKGNLEPIMTKEVRIQDLIDYIVRGGWPANLDIPISRANLVSEEYIEAIITDDAYRIDGIKRDTHKMRLLLRSLARNESTTVSNNNFKNDIKEIDDEDIDIETVASYLDISDPSLACALLKATPDILLNDLETLGFLFEALCERDLRIYAESFDAKLYHYQDYNNKEIDAVIEMKDGSWAAFEIKLGANQIDAAAESLIKLKNSIVADEKGIPPKVLCVICGLSNAAYKREDGVYVVPITALKD